MSAPKLTVSRRIRATPYTPKVESLGVSGYSVVNHTILAKGFRKSVEEDYWHLKEHVQLWDVGCQRQVELKGPDAAKLTQLMTPRDLRQATAGQCLYAPLVDGNGLMLNDPIILKLADNHFWLSIADSDILLWAKGLALGMKLNVKITEPDVWPLAVQGPKSDDLMAQVFGPSIRDLKFFQFDYFDFDRHPLLIARSGYSKQGGFEIYLDKPSIGTELWDALWQAGKAFNISPGCPNLIERVEGGLLSYGNEFTMANNLFECGFDEYCQLDNDVEFIGKQALQQIAKRGRERLIRGVIFDGGSCPPCQQPWPLTINEEFVGEISTAIWSPRFQRNVALAMLEKGFWQAGTQVEVSSSDGLIRKGLVTDLPMQDKQIRPLLPAD
ncbi:MAG: dimethylsulfoniopropionate demethylase [Gammaproteobacteria bacterium]|nr:dimethylsulfoniopropionate demethylase [Gammaproteobacteria bacterium]